MDNFNHCQKNHNYQINQYINYITKSTNLNCYIITKIGIKKMMENDCINNIIPVDELLANKLKVISFKYAITDQELRENVPSDILSSKLLMNY